jgi:hypothetical protein
MAGEFYMPAPLSVVLNGYQVGWLQNLGAVQKIKICLCLAFSPGGSAPTQEGRQNVSVNEERNLLEVITPHLFHTYVSICRSNSTYLNLRVFDLSILAWCCKTNNGLLAMSFGSSGNASCLVFERQPLLMSGWTVSRIRVIMILFRAAGHMLR